MGKWKPIAEAPKKTKIIVAGQFPGGRGWHWWIDFIREDGSFGTCDDTIIPTHFMNIEPPEE